MIGRLLLVKLKDEKALCDIFELTPERAAIITNMNNNYKRAVHAVRAKNKLIDPFELAKKASAPDPPPTPTPAPSDRASALALLNKTIDDSLEAGDGLW